eukprot:GDKJ01063735.1.p1 GENE.GDKJ01063735.1~~GDKJ01063735.1.p1  ORF type:complete len:410 (-),score=98.81 GDKJ01063735.1:29-1258(-)
MFEGELSTTITCCQCLKNRVKCEKFKDLQLHIPSSSSSFDKAAVSLRTLIEEQLEKKKIVELRCEACHHPFAFMSSKISHPLPRVLVILLKRFQTEWNRNLNKMMTSKSHCIVSPNFSLKVHQNTFSDSSGKVLEEKKDFEGDSANYDLCSCVLHKGEEISSGHYVSIVKPTLVDGKPLKRLSLKGVPLSHQFSSSRFSLEKKEESSTPCVQDDDKTAWLCYDDLLVTMVTEEDDASAVMSVEGYLFFYQAEFDKEYERDQKAEDDDKFGKEEKRYNSMTMKAIRKANKDFLIEWEGEPTFADATPSAETHVSSVQKPNEESTKKSIFQSPFSNISASRLGMSSSGYVSAFDLQKQGGRFLTPFTDRHRNVLKEACTSKTEQIEPDESVVALKRGAEDVLQNEDRKRTK